MRNDRHDADGHLIELEVDPTTEADRAEAASAGLVPVREILQLRVPLPLSSIERGPEIATRPFLIGHDDDALLALNNRAFAWHPDQSDWTVADLHARCVEDWFDADGLLLHERDGRLAGFCWTKVHPATDLDPALGEIFVIGVDPDRHGQGLGRALTVAGLDHLSNRGLRTGMLHVEHDNTAARRLYESLGFTEHSSHCWWRRPEGNRS